MQPAIAAAICLLGSNCTSHVGYLQRTLGFAEDYPGYQDLLRGSAAGLGAIALRGNAEVLGHLFDVGIPSQDPVRAPVTLALGLVALRNTPLMLKTLEGGAAPRSTRRPRRCIAPRVPHAAERPVVSPEVRPARRAAAPGIPAT